jgi:2-oxoglutarate dehydrogenase E2 component (dihydrolipoamide succinyltransferase)
MYNVHYTLYLKYKNMAFEMKVPVVGESISEVTIAKWNKKDGDFVQLDELLCELESDKATFELTASQAGVLKIVAQEGETLAIGALICTLSEGAAQVAASAAPAVVAAPSAAAPSATGQVLEMKVPNVGESIAEVTLGTWTKKEGDFVNQDELLCEIESDKATFELTAEASGILSIIAPSGTTLPIGAPICKIAVSTGGAPVAAAPVAAAATAAPSTGGANYAAGHAAPAAAKILAEKGVAASAVSGTGKNYKRRRCERTKNCCSCSSICCCCTCFIW